MSGILRLRGATEHNLQGIDLNLPHGEWIAVVGPSGSGKTSLVFGTLVREGQCRFLGTLSPRARQYFGKLGRASVRELTGLPAAIALGERAFTANLRSTVGTMTGVLDLLRLAYARCAVDPEGASLTRSHFSFNHPVGACESCGGIGVEDRVDPELLVADAGKSLRDGALVPTLKNGYTVYSQVTLDVMETICEAHGFDVHTPWRELTDEQRNVIFFGTTALQVPFGKHPIESRMKWEGITARPREEGYYRGLVPVIEETLKRNRNPNVLRFVRSVPCTVCAGSRLSRPGREAMIGTIRLPELLALPVQGLMPSLDQLPPHEVLQALRPEIDARLDRMIRLGLGHLSLGRESTTLSGGEAQRLGLVAQLTAGLSGTLFAFDEPTLGLHPSAQEGMRAVLSELRALGNTLIVVEHDPDMVRHADRIVRLGPGAGPEGGRVLPAGEPSLDPLGPPPTPKAIRRPSGGQLTLRGATLHNLEGDDFTVELGALNVVIGPSGAGKSSLVFGTLLPALTGAPGGPFASLDLGELSTTVRALDARPIGRTSRSTPATWSGLFDLVRKSFADSPDAKRLGFGPGHFSFNNKEGRCPACEGLGVIRVGLHLVEDAEILCPECGGGRYAPAVLVPRLGGKTIAEVLALTVRDAVSFFADDRRVANLCRAMDDLGLGYVSLGQPSGQLSRGESQRVKLATLLGTTDAAPTLLLLDEPDRGLHPTDLALLIRALDRLIEAGHTVVAISHHRHLWAAADVLVELEDGAIRRDPEVDWGRVGADARTIASARPLPSAPSEIHLAGVSTNNLQGIDVRIPRGKLTGICGVSGSGKSSLAFGTLAAEAWQRFAESLPFEVRRQVRRMPRPRLEAARGLGPTLSLRQGEHGGGARSTVATQSGVGPTLRLLFARAGKRDGTPCGLTAEHFSSDRALGACPACHGRGVLELCDPDRLVTSPERSLLRGALAGTKPGEFFSEPEGRYVATLRAALFALAAEPGDGPREEGGGPALRVSEAGVDLSAPWRDLPAWVRRVALEGAGERVFQVSWEFGADKREGDGAHQFQSKWSGFLALTESEARKRAGHKNAAAWSAPLVPSPCPKCTGSGLGVDARAVTLGGTSDPTSVRARTLPELLLLPMTDLLAFLGELVRLGDDAVGASAHAAIRSLVPEIRARLADLERLGLGHLPLGRYTDALSSGERQRVRLAAVLRAELSGATIVLDEPSAGLQPRETRVLIAALRGLCDEGNTVVVVEHDRDVLRAADHLIELGPGAGPDGGRIVAEGAPEEVLSDEPTKPTRSPRADGQADIQVDARADAQTDAQTDAQVDARADAQTDARATDTPRVRFRGIDAGPIRGLDLDLPRSGLVSIVGPSGSGKSTLLFDVIEASFRAGTPAGCDAIEPVDALTHFRSIHGRATTLRAGSVLTALGLMTPFQRFYHAAAGASDLPAQAFSFHSPKGRCPACGGTGHERVAMDFMADLDLPCPVCEGRRYRPEPLAVRWDGLDPSEFLDQPATSLASRLPDSAKSLRAGLDALVRAGLGHLALGREVRTLSGGEVQRLGLAQSLMDRGSPALHLFDEPGAGQHPADLERLVSALGELCTRGDLVVIADHRRALIDASCRVVHLGG
ncbi:MAG: AAA family ATPase [Candidatus Eisenbacteria bacterium]